MEQINVKWICLNIELVTLLWLFNSIILRRTICYHSLTQSNRAYYVLESFVVQLKQNIKDIKNNYMNIMKNNYGIHIPHQIAGTNNVSFGIDSVTPICRRNDNGNINDIGFAFNNTMNDTFND